MALDDARHPDAERLAEYADGVLDVAARAEVERHLTECADCRAVVTETMAFLDAGPAISDLEPSRSVIPFRRRRWLIGAAAGLAAAAAVVLAVRIVQPAWTSGLFGARGSRPELQELIAAVANEPTRPVEGRLSGGFKYGPPPSPTRGPVDREVSPNVRIAAAKIEELAAGNHDADATVGVAYLAVLDVDRAIALLTEAARVHPSDVSVQNDLAVALIERASRSRTRADMEAARVAADRAVAVDPQNAAASFNRALTLELLGSADAAGAWTAARALQRDEPWRLEADRHLAALRDRGAR